MDVLCIIHLNHLDPHDTTMPELPEVETTRQGIAPYLINQTIDHLTIRTDKLRFPISATLKKLSRCKISGIERRAKYLLLITEKGTLIIHLGMSGSMRILTEITPPKKHDHIDLVLTNKTVLRYNDPRKFGCWLWVTNNLHNHKLLAELGPEPLNGEFNAAYLYQQSRNKKIAVKKFIMNQKIVVGIGNIYANEALFLADIHPSKEAKQLSQQECQQLVSACKKILKQALKIGGTTIRNFSGADGNPGYFAQELMVYGRKDMPCKKCRTLLKEIRIDNRSTVFCEICQSI